LLLQLSHLWTIIQTSGHCINLVSILTSVKTVSSEVVQNLVKFKLDKPTVYVTKIMTSIDL